MDTSRELRRQVYPLDAICLGCMVDLSNTELVSDIIITNCKHLFCDKCIPENIYHSKSCPFCKTECETISLLKGNPHGNILELITIDPALLRNKAASIEEFQNTYNIARFEATRVNLKRIRDENSQLRHELENLKSSLLHDNSGSSTAQPMQSASDIRNDETPRHEFRHGWLPSTPTQLMLPSPSKQQQAFEAKIHATPTKQTPSSHMPPSPLSMMRSVRQSLQLNNSSNRFESKSNNSEGFHNQHNPVSTSFIASSPQTRNLPTIGRSVIRSPSNPRPIINHRPHTASGFPHVTSSLNQNRMPMNSIPRNTQNQSPLESPRLQPQGRNQSNTLYGSNTFDRQNIHQQRTNYENNHLSGHAVSVKNRIHGISTSINSMSSQIPPSSAIQLSNATTQRVFAPRSPISMTIREDESLVSSLKSTLPATPRRGLPPPVAFSSNPAMSPVTK